MRIYEAPDVMNLSQWSLQHEIPCKLPISCLSWNSTLSKNQTTMIAVGSDDSNLSNGAKVSNECFLITFPLTKFSEFSQIFPKSAN